MTAGTRKIRRTGGVLALALALVLTATGLRAEAVPQHLAALAAAVHRQAGDRLAACDLTPEQRAAAERARAALRDFRIRNFPADTVSLPGAARDLAPRLGLDLAKEADRALLGELLAMDEAAARAALAKRLPEAELPEALSALTAAKRPAPELATRYQHRTPEGDLVTLDWRPATGDMVVEVSNDGSGGAEPFETALVGETRLVPNPETGALDVEVSPAETPVSILTKADFERIARSIFAEWRTEQGEVWVFAPLSEADREAGNVRRSPAAVRADIEAAERRIREIEAAKEYVWVDETTGETVRQSRFRRLDEPWTFKGEQPLIADAEAQVAKLHTRIAELRRELSGADLPPVLRDDPIGYDEAGTAGATPIRVTVTLTNGYTYTWDEANFDGRRVRGRRVLRSLRDNLNEELPMAIREQLIASWSPPNWLDLTATIDPVTNELKLAGARWSLHVTWSRDMFGSSPEVVEIKDPYPNPLRMTLPGSASLMAWGAADDATP
jgi:hypothetical protein